MKNFISIVWMLLGMATLFLAISQKQDDDVQIEVENTPPKKFEKDIYEDAESYYRHKQERKRQGHAKLDAPEEFALIERARRTPDDLLVPEYAPNYKLNALSSARSSKNVNKANDLTFIERGPANVAGRTRALLILPDDPDAQTWIAGSATGGIWKTSDGGQSWTDKTPDFPNLGTNTLAFSKADPNIIYAGTGEHFTNDIDGNGLFKSTDQGETWSQVVTADQYDAFRNVSRIVVHPDNPDIIIATTRNSVFEDSLRAAIYKSIDGGQTWDQKLFSTEDRYDDIAVNPENFNTLYVAVRRKGVLKSKDQGETWTDASKGLEVRGRIEIATSPLDTNVIWGSAQGDASGTGSDLYQSEDGSDTWRLAVEGEGNPIDFLGGQGWYDNVIEPHPYDRNTVYVGGVNLFKMRVSESEIEDVIYDIVDEGAFQFLDFINGVTIGGGILEGRLPANEVKSVQLRFGQGGQKAHRFTVGGQGAGVTASGYRYLDLVDIPFQAWDIENNRQLMVSFRDQAEDSTWTLKTRTLNSANTAEDSREYIFIHDVDYTDTAHSEISLIGGHEFRQLYFMWPVLRDGQTFDPSVTNDPKAFSIYSELVTRRSAATTVISDAYNGFNGNNGFAGSLFANNEGHHPDQHSLHFIIIDSVNKWFQLVTTNDGGVYKTNVSRDPGTTDNSFNYAGFRYNTTQFYGADKMPGADRYFGGMQDNSTWVSPAGESADERSIYDFAFGGDGFEAIWNNRDPDLMIGSVQFNSFRRSVDRGRTWQSATSGITDNGPFISRLANSRALPERLFTVGSSGVWKSEDFGASWTSTPIQNLWSYNNSIDIEVSGANPDVIWAGGALRENGRFFVSRDGGETFTPSADYTAVTMGTSSGLGVHPEQEGTAYALFSFARRPKVLKTEDFGESWTDISGFESGSGISTNGFPDVAVNCILVFPNDTNRIWVGSEIGIIESLDNGESWHLLDGNIPSVSIFDMKIQDDQIVIATYGRGIWTVQVEGIARTYIFPPAIKAVAVTPQGNVKLSTDLSSPFDSITIIIDDVLIGPTLPGSFDIGNFSINLGITSVLTDGTHEFKLIGYNDGIPYESFGFQADIFVPGKPKKEYKNDLSIDTLKDDFIGSGFSVRLEPGFVNEAIHSNHNYTDRREITYQLRTPIIVAEDQLFTYNDVVIVEPGEANVPFGQQDFFDYVVVEGSEDGVRWRPLQDGYDSTFDPNWLATYNAEGRGNASLFVAHEVDLLDAFSEEDTIFIRFRLYADPFVNGWGWAIDDLDIFLESTTPVFEPSFEELLIYPNPAREQLTIQLPQGSGERLIRIYDAQGRLIQASTLRSTTLLHVDTRDYQEGMYFVDIFEDQRRVATEKVVVIH